MKGERLRVRFSVITPARPLTAASAGTEQPANWPYLSVDVLSTSDVSRGSLSHTSGPVKLPEPALERLFRLVELQVSDPSLSCVMPATASRGAS